MNSMAAVTGVMAILMTLALVSAVRALYRVAIFKLMAEQREIILKSTDLLDQDHGLSEVEIRAIATSIIYLYDYRMKRSMAREVLDFIRNNAKIPQTKPIRDDVRKVSRAFAALVLAENPVYTVRMLKIMSERRSSNRNSSEQSALARAEMTIASQLPKIDIDACHAALA